MACVNGGRQVEADCYWCLAKMLDSIQDHYTFAQPGIQRQARNTITHSHALEPSLASVTFSWDIVQTIVQDSKIASGTYVPEGILESCT